MIIGHWGIAVTARWARPHVSLLWLLVAAIAPDLVDVGLALAGVCNPFGLYTHTIPAALLIGACLAGAAVLAGRRETAALVLLVVMLHLPLDYLTGRKLYWPGGELYGLLLYERPLVDFLMETAVLLVGWMLLRRTASSHSVPAPPRWATRAAGVALLILLQGAVDLAGSQVKPNACSAARGSL